MVVSSSLHKGSSKGPPPLNLESVAALKEEWQQSYTHPAAAQSCAHQPTRLASLARKSRMSCACCIAPSLPSSSEPWNDRRARGEGRCPEERRERENERRSSDARDSV